RALGEQGVFADGEAQGRDAIRMAKGLDHPNSLIFAWLNLAHLHGVRGQLRDAATLLEQAADRGPEWDITLWTPIVPASLGHVYARLGRLEEGIRRLEQAMSLFDATGYGYLHSISLVQLGEAYLLANRLSEASACAERAVTLCRQR